MAQIKSALSLRARHISLRPLCSAWSIAKDVAIDAVTRRGHLARMAFCANSKLHRAARTMKPDDAGILLCDSLFDGIATIDEFLPIGIRSQNCKPMVIYSVFKR
jgi:hypothetical protein